MDKKVRENRFVILEESLIIHSSMEKVWNTFTDFTAWTHWNTVMKAVRSDGKYLTEGKGFECSFCPFLFPIRLRIIVEEVAAYERIVWSTKKMGLFASSHEFLFQKHEKGVVVISKETFTGLLIKAFRFLLPVKTMRALTKTFLIDLGKASERSV